MFTGLVTHRGELTVATKHADGGLTLSISNPFPDCEPVSDGESIAINGCCLTALVSNGAPTAELSFFVSEETLALTTMGSLSPKTLVNLERAMKLGDRFGGHIVSGHIDCIGHIEEVQPISGSTCFTVAYPAEHGAMIIVKGSVTIDGVSLTVNELLEDSNDREHKNKEHKDEKHEERCFTVNIIPHTNAQTGFSRLAKGGSVNLEFDMFAKFAFRSEQLRELSKSETFTSSPAELAESIEKG